MVPYETSLLADRPDAVPLVARWYYAEWGRHDGKTQDGMTARLRQQADNRDTLPLFVVAAEGETIAGAAALVPHDMEILTDLTPWVSSVYVDPARHRIEPIVELLVGQQLSRGSFAARQFAAHLIEVGAR